MRREILSPATPPVPLIAPTASSPAWCIHVPSIPNGPENGPTRPTRSSALAWRVHVHIAAHAISSHARWTTRNLNADVGVTSLLLLVILGCCSLPGRCALLEPAA